MSKKIASKATKAVATSAKDEIAKCRAAIPEGATIGFSAARPAIDAAIKADPSNAVALDLRDKCDQGYKRRDAAWALDQLEGSLA